MAYPLRILDKTGWLAYDNSLSPQRAMMVIDCQAGYGAPEWSYSPMPVDITIEFPSARTINALLVDVGFACWVKSFDFYTSPDKTTWNFVATYTTPGAQSTGSRTIPYLFRFSSVEALAVKLHITDADGFADITEVDVFDFLTPQAASTNGLSVALVDRRAVSLAGVPALLQQGQTWADISVGNALPVSEIQAQLLSRVPSPYPVVTLPRAMGFSIVKQTGEGGGSAPPTKGQLFPTGRN